MGKVAVRVRPEAFHREVRKYYQGQVGPHVWMRGTRSPLRLKPLRQCAAYRDIEEAVTIASLAVARWRKHTGDGLVKLPEPLRRNGDPRCREDGARVMSTLREWHRRASRGKFALEARNLALHIGPAESWVGECHLPLTLP